jgi:hypothetical protein
LTWLSPRARFPGLMHVVSATWDASAVMVLERVQNLVPKPECLTRLGPT